MAKVKIQTTKPVVPMIYAYTTPGVIYHDGWTKIGYTERDVDIRIKEQTQTANIIAKKEWQDLAIFSDGKTKFTDKEFHAYLSKNNIERRLPQQDDEGCPEWFKISGDASYTLFSQFRKDMGILQTLGVTPYALREEQKRAVQQTKNYFLDDSNRHEFLWNAKPRFGKTLTAYNLCKSMQLQKILIITNRPAIANSWYSDYVKFLGTESGYCFVSNVSALKNQPHVLSREEFLQKSAHLNFKGCIEFISLQDLKGSLYFGGSYDKLEEVAELEWDILVIDEAHEGIDTYKTDIAFDQIKRKYTLHLSGTPFKALASEKFEQKAIFNWTYTEEQQAKRDWDSSREEENPYANLPQLNLFTYKMSDIVQEHVAQGADFLQDGNNEAYYWSLNEFFKVNASGTFKYEDAVDKFLDALTKQEKFPFSTEELRQELKHTLWILKYVNSAKALAKKLKEHAVFKDYEIVLAAGDGKIDDEGNFADNTAMDKQLSSSYSKVKNAITKNDKTITLSVGQLTTGITIPEWTAVMMLSDIQSPALYMQAAFRAQNPCMFNKNGEQWRKENAYIFDFDPTRTLKKIEEFANDLLCNTINEKGDSNERKQNVRELLNFFPVYGEDEAGEMIALDAEQVLSIPRVLQAKEVVKCGFMSNFLFQNVGNIFNAPQDVLDIIYKFDTTKEYEIKTYTKKELNINHAGEVEIPEEKIIGTAKHIFGDKLYGDVAQDLLNSIENIQKEEAKNFKKDKKLEKLLETFNSKVTLPLVQTAKDAYGADLSKSAQKALTQKLTINTEKVVKKQYGEYQIQCNKLENEREKEIKKAEKLGNKEAIAEIQQTFDMQIESLEKDFYNNLNASVPSIIEESAKSIVQTIETEKNEKKKNSMLDTIKEHSRSFSRTIPYFIMAYGNENTTLENFDKSIPDSVFKEVTNISLEEFRILRDGYPYIDDGGHEQRYNGFFDSVVFNDSIQEFLRLKKKLSNYFEEDMTEDIFDYIPPQKTNQKKTNQKKRNQIYTPKKVVIEMVDNLEKENRGCFDNPNHTFIDLYMKSGLFITEIVKRLYRSENIKALYPNTIERLNHIFAKQVYGLAPTEIIYKIATNFILGFSEDIKIEKHNFRLCDATPYVQDGTLEAKLDELFKE